jgi:hypothetical protein
MFVPQAWQLLLQQQLLTLISRTCLAWPAALAAAPAASLLYQQCQQQQTIMMTHLLPLGALMVQLLPSMQHQYSHQQQQQQQSRQ